MAEAQTRLVGVTFLFELPLDLGVDGGHTELVVRGKPTKAPFRIRIVLRSQDGAKPPSVHTALEAFGDFFDGLQLQDDLPSACRDGIGKATVAAVTVLHPTRARHIKVTESWLTRRFEEAFRTLDRFLTCLGFISAAPDVGALRRTDLPSHVPVIIDDGVSEGQVPRQALLTALQLYDFEDWRSDFVSRPGVVETASFLFEGMTSGSSPFRLFIEHVQRARRDLHDGRTDQAVLSAGTAVEVLVAVSLRTFWHAEHERQETIDKKLGGGFQNLLKDHLRPRLVALGGEGKVVDDWVSECYLLRNDVAHEGLVPGHAQAKVAVRATVLLGAEIAQVLRNQARFRRLGESLPIRPPTTEERGRAELARLLQ